MKGELINKTRAWDKEKKSESPTGIEPMTSLTPAFIHLSLLTMTLTVLILAVCRTPDAFELS